MKPMRKDRLKNLMKTLLPFPLLLSSMFSGCGANLDFGRKIAEPQTFSLDGVKWISPRIEDPADASTLTQSTYSISSEGRLLLRFESLKDKAGEISLGKERKVTLTLALDSGENLASARSSLRICPLVKNWMMLATWKKAYPQGRSGNWQTDGGDFDSANCVSALDSTTMQKVALKKSGSSYETLTFDVTEWVVNELKGRARNFGFVLLSENGGTVKIRGDLDTAYSPRISWIRTF